MFLRARRNSRGPGDERVQLADEPLQLVGIEAHTGAVADSPKPRRGTRCQRGTDATIAALRRGGVVEVADEATVALARYLAAALDRLDPLLFPAQAASLARAHLATIRLLRGIGDDRGNPPLGDELLALLSAPLGDGENPEP
jgi:hypothetical protein